MMSYIKDLLMIKTMVSEFINHNPSINGEEQRAQLISALFLIIIGYLKDSEKNRIQIMEVIQDLWDLLSELNELNREVLNGSK